MMYFLLLATLLAVTPLAVFAGGATPPEATPGGVHALPADAGIDTTPDDVQRRRTEFVKLIKLGLLERFDDARQEVVFKRGEPPRSSHVPGPLEDEAIASAVRETLGREYGKLGFKPIVTCAAGKISLANLPKDTTAAASVIDTLLGLDGVERVAAVLPPSLRMP
jgi:hypothetical protein